MPDESAIQEVVEKEYLSLDGPFFSDEMQSLLKQRVPVIANVALILFVVGVALDALAEVFQPFLMALLVYFILKPVAIWLYDRTPFGMGLSYFFAVIGFVVLVGLVFVAAIWNIQSWVSDDVARNELTKNFESIVAWANDRGVIDVSDYNSLDAIITPSMQADFIGAAGGAVFSTLTMILFLAFIIYEVPLLEARVARAFPSQRALQVVAVSKQIETSINAYLGTKTYVSLGTGICTSAICLLLGVPLWFVWGLIAFLFNYVPYVGSLVASVPPIVLSFLVPGNFFFVIEVSQVVSGVVVTSLIAINQQLWGSVIETKWTGNKLDVSPVLLLLAFAYGGLIWGPIGMILSAPVTVILKIVFENIEATRPIGVLMQERVRSLREIYQEALEDGSFSRAEQKTITRYMSELGITEAEAYLVAARAAFDVAHKDQRCVPNDTEMRIITRAMDHLDLGKEKRQEILAVLDDGYIDEDEAAMLDQVFPSEQGEFSIEAGDDPNEVVKH